VRRNLELGPYLSGLLVPSVDRDYMAVLEELTAMRNGGK
jgi:hypothetical protein